MGVGIEQRLLEVERGSGQALSDDEALGGWEVLGTRDEPVEQVEGARENHHLIGHMGVLSVV